MSISLGRVLGQPVLVILSTDGSPTSGIGPMDAHQFSLRMFVGSSPSAGFRPLHLRAPTDGHR